MKPSYEELERMYEQARAAAERPKCLYCTFGEDADFTIEDLKRHIESECDFHPLRKMRAALMQADEALDFCVGALGDAVNNMLDGPAGYAVIRMAKDARRLYVKPALAPPPASPSPATGEKEQG